jgi:aconitate hydratase
MSQRTTDTFSSRATLQAGGRTYTYYRLEALEKAGFSVGRLPFSVRILLENLLRNEDGLAFLPDHTEALARWSPEIVPDREIPFMPARVLLQDFTGVPALVDLAAMRDALAAMGAEATRINPQLPSELVIDHSVTGGTASDTPSFAGARRPSTTSRWCRRTPASSTR